MKTYRSIGYDDSMHTTGMKRQLILSLMELASDRGLSNVPTSLLAKENGIAKASLFHHFATREELEDQLYAQGKAMAQAKGFTISLEGTASEVLFRAMDHWHAIHAEEPLVWFYRIIETEKLIDERARTIERSLSHMLEGQSRILLETLAETGRLDIEEPDLAVLTFSATTHAFLVRLMSGEDEDLMWQEERFIRRFCALYGGR